MSAIPKIAVPAPEVTSIGKLKFEITKGWNGGGLWNFSLQVRLPRKDDQIFRETVLNKFLIFFFDRRTLPERTFDQEVETILAQLIEFIVITIIEIRLLQSLQAAVGR